MGKLKIIHRAGDISSEVIIIIITLAVVVFYSCSNRGTERSTASEKKPAHPVIRYAKRLEIQHLDGYSQVTVSNPWQGVTGLSQTWYLIPEGSEVPSGLNTSGFITVPVRKIICMSTTHAAMISALGESESVAGISGTRFIFEKSLVERIEKGLVSEIGYEDNLNKEKIISISPDLVMAYGVGSESQSYIGKIKELGMKVIYNADYLETEPLGKAEWIKLFGALYDKEALADSLFRDIEEEYMDISSFILSNTLKRPAVLLGLPFRDSWYISPGNSYISRLISDAGGNYLWSDTESEVSMAFGIENVFLKALKAEYWLNIGSVNFKDEITSVDPRLADLPCVITGNLYNNNKRMSPGGGNDYWESGCLKPHIILKDVASVIHPGIFGEYELVYYKRIY